MRNGWPAPASQTRCQLGRSDGLGTDKMRFNHRRNDLKTWPATTRRFRSGSADEQAKVSRSELLFRILREAAGVGQPFEEIFDFRFAISDFEKRMRGQANQKSAIKNRK